MAASRTPSQLPLRLDPHELRVLLPGFAHYFRYPLQRRDFHPLRADADAETVVAAKARLLGYYAAKPLYGALDDRGRVDRSAGFNGELVAVFVPSPARSWRHARLVHARMPRDRVRRVDGKRNWPAIRRVLEATIRQSV